MTDETTDKTVTRTSPAYEGVDVNWLRIEGIVAVGALLASFIWFLGMPTGMAIGVGFGLVLLLDFVRVLIFESSRSDGSELDKPEIARH